MSTWDPYIERGLINFKKGNNQWNMTVEKAAIIVNDTTNTPGFHQGTICASTKGFDLSPKRELVDKENGSGQEYITIDEYANICTAFKTKANDLGKGGIRLDGVKYQVTNFDEDKGVIYLRKISGGACIAKTNNLFIIGIYNTREKMIKNGKEINQNVGDCNTAVETLQAKFIECGY